MILFNQLFIIKQIQLTKFKKYSKYINGRVVDVGCGIKPYKRFVKFREYIGIDETESLNPDIVCKVESIPIADNSVDSAICTEVLEHLKEPDKCLKDIFRILKSGGYLYLTVPQTWGLHYEPNDYWRFTNYGVKYLCENAGFKIIRIDRIGGIFSIIGARLSDILWTKIKELLFFIPEKMSEKISSIFILPVNILFYIMSNMFDNIDKRDAIGWLILCQKK